MKIQESGENYLETILLLERRNGMVRSIDIANEMAYSKPSVSRAVRILKENGLIEMEQSGRITLTEKGRARAESIFERHELVTAFLVSSLGVSPETAEHDACKIEHIISEETFAAIKQVLRTVPTDGDGCQ